MHGREAVYCAARTQRRAPSSSPRQPGDRPDGSRRYLFADVICCPYFIIIGRLVMFNPHIITPTSKRKEVMRETTNISVWSGSGSISERNPRGNWLLRTKRAGIDYRQCTWRVSSVVFFISFAAADAVKRHFSWVSGKIRRDALLMDHVQRRPSWDVESFNLEVDERPNQLKLEALGFPLGPIKLRIEGDETLSSILFSLCKICIMLLHRDTTDLYIYICWNSLDDNPCIA